MPRMLKTFITNIGFFELALAAPSMKAALEAWGMGHSAFQHGFAKQTDDPKIVAATMAKPGTVLRRAVGTQGANSRNMLSCQRTCGSSTSSRLDAARGRRPTCLRNHPPRLGAPQTVNRIAPRFSPSRKPNSAADAARQKEEAEANAKRQKDQIRIERALAKADNALERAKAHHERIAATIAADQEKLDRRAAAEKNGGIPSIAKLEEVRARVEKR